MPHAGCRKEVRQSSLHRVEAASWLEHTLEFPECVFQVLVVLADMISNQMVKEVEAHDRVYGGTPERKGRGWPKP